MNFLRKSYRNTEQSDDIQSSISDYPDNQSNNFERALHSFLLFCIILSGAVFTDVFLLPVNKTETKVNDVYFFLQNSSKIHIVPDLKFTGLNNDELICRIETDKKIFSIHPDYYTCFATFQTITIQTSYLMKFLLSVNTPNCNNVTPYLYIKSWFILMPLALFIFGMLGLYNKTSNALITFTVLNIILMAAFLFLMILY
jgi:hypothetical protein